MNHEARLIYWLINALLFPHEKSTEKAWEFLAELGYDQDGDRVARMLELGEPNSPPQILLENGDAPPPVGSAFVYTGDSGGLYVPGLGDKLKFRIGK